MIRVVEFRRRLNNEKMLLKINTIFLKKKKKFLHSADYVHFGN